MSAARSRKYSGLSIAVIGTALYCAALHFAAIAENVIAAGLAMKPLFSAASRELR
jgi:hypothetical protein